MHLFPEYKQVFLNLSPDALLVTPNQRLSRFIIKQHSLWLGSTENSVWKSLNCLSWNSWLASLWDEVQILGVSRRTERHVLNVNQERVLWEQIVEKSTDEQFLSCKALADASKQAWSYIRKWRHGLDDVPSDSEESKLLKQWVKTYQQVTEQEQLIDSTGVLELLTVLIRDGEEIPLPSQLIFVGFDDVSPLDKNLIDLLACSERDIQFLDIPMSSNCNRVELADTSAEITTMMRWAAGIVERESKASVALVVPNLAEIRPLVERIYLEVFEPQYKFSELKRHAPAVNISAGQPLAQAPLIVSAMLSLKLNSRDIDVDELYTILSSSFIGSLRELTQQIKLVTTLRAEYKRVPVAVLRASISERSEVELTNLSVMIESFEKIRLKHQNRKHKASFWADVFCEQLTSLGWPGERTLDTLEYQQLSHWPGMLQDLAGLDLVLPEVDMQTALAELNKIAYVPFHAKTLESPIQILGLLEAAGQQFDYLWVMGLDYRAWPESCQPNPMLPVSFQRQLEMPRSSNEKELKLAEKLTMRLASSAAQVIFSHSVIDGDQPLRVSPLIENFPLISADKLELYQLAPYMDVIESSRADFLHEATATPVDTFTGVKGGAQVLKDQAACPFRAFAKHRLRAVNGEIFEEGVSPLIRGNLLHASLEKVWMSLKNSSRLVDSNPDDLHELIKTAMSRSWKDIGGCERLGVALREIEMRRGLRLILQWLEIEKLRSPFLVFEYEKSLEMDISGMQLTVRFDRVDILENTQELIVIDYKTGMVDVKSWATDRPDDPQVPLYCIALADKSVVAAVFAQINGKEVSAKGIGLHPNLIPGVRTPNEFERLELPSDWKAIQEFWALNLESLARDFMMGDARVKPKSTNTTCLHCDLKSVCRVGVTDS